MSANRKDFRAALKTELEARCPSAQVVYPYQPNTLAQASPVIYLTSAGSQRPRRSFAGNDTTFNFNVHLCAWYGDGNTTWTEEQAEDALDTLEKEVSDALLAIQPLLDNLGIVSLIMPEPSEAQDMLQVAGEFYLHEIIPILLKPKDA